MSTTSINLNVPGWMNPNVNPNLCLVEEEEWGYPCDDDVPGQIHNCHHRHCETTPSYGQECNCGASLAMYHSTCGECATKTICKPAREAATVTLLGLRGKVHKDLVEMLSQMVSLTRYQEEWVPLQQEEPRPLWEFTASGPGGEEQPPIDYEDLLLIGYSPTLLNAPQKPNRKRERNLELWE